MGTNSYLCQELENLPTDNHCKSSEIIEPNENFHEYKRPIEKPNDHHHGTYEEIKRTSDKPIYNSRNYHTFEENSDTSNNNIKPYDNIYQVNSRPSDEHNSSFDHTPKYRLGMKDCFNNTNNNISINSNLILAVDDSYMENDMGELVLDDSYFTEDMMSRSASISPSKYNKFINILQIIC